MYEKKTSTKKNRRLGETFDSDGLEQKRYKVSIRNAITGDISERISRLHASAIEEAITVPSLSAGSGLTSSRHQRSRASPSADLSSDLNAQRSLPVLE